MLDALAALVEARPDGLSSLQPGLAQPAKKVVTTHVDLDDESERANTASTCATEEITPFLVQVHPEPGGIPLGVILSCDDDPRFLTLDGVQERGLIAEWNASHGDELKVRQHQSIASVNGITNSAQDMLAALKSIKPGVPLKLLIQGSCEGDTDASDPSTILSLEGIVTEEALVPLRDPFTVQLSLGRQSLPLGIAVSIDDDPSYVSIEQVNSPGLIAEWNSSQTEEYRVNVGDTITAVNRCSGSGRQLLDILTSISKMNRGAVMQISVVPRRPQKQSLLQRFFRDDVL